MPNISTAERGDWSRVEFLSSQPRIDVGLSPQAGSRRFLSFAEASRKSHPFAFEDLRYASLISDRTDMDWKKRQFKKRQGALDGE